MFKKIVLILGLLTTIVACEDGQKIMEPGINAILTQELASEEHTTNVEEPEPQIIKLDAEQLEELYLDLPDFKETFLKGDGNVEVGMYHVQISDFGSRVRIEKEKVIGTSLSFGYLQLNYGDIKNQYCNPIWIDGAILVFNITSPKFEIQKEDLITIYNFDIQIIGARREGKGADLVTLPDGTLTIQPSKHEWQLPQTEKELEENCW